MRQIKIFERPRALSLALSAALIVIGLALAEFSLKPMPVSADSEASSEAGLEAPLTGGRRRRGYRNYRNQNNQNNPQTMMVKKELARESKERNQQLKREQRNLSRGPMIREYGHSSNRQSGSNQGQNGQSGQFGQTGNAGQFGGQANQGRQP